MPNYPKKKGEKKEAHTQGGARKQKAEEKERQMFLSPQSHSMPKHGSHFINYSTWRSYSMNENWELNEIQIQMMWLLSGKY